MNLIVVGTYILVIIDLIVGSVMISSLANTKSIYEEDNRDTYSDWTIQFLILQKVFFSTIMLT